MRYLIVITCTLLLLAVHCADPKQEKTETPKYTEKPYDVNGETTREVRKDIFDDKQGKGPKDDKGEHRAGRTKVSYEIGFGGPSDSTATDGKCSCTVTSKSVMERHTYEVILPKWTGYENASKDCKGKWDEFIKNLKKHEEKHVRIYDKGIKKALESAKKKWEGKSESKTAPTCKAACDAAFAALQASIQKDFETELGKTETEQEAYDTQTKHGETEGAVLKDCDPA